MVVKRRERPARRGSGLLPPTDLLYISHGLHGAADATSRLGRVCCKVALHCICIQCFNKRQFCGQASQSGAWISDTGLHRHYARVTSTEGVVIGMHREWATRERRDSNTGSVTSTDASNQRSVRQTAMAMLLTTLVLSGCGGGSGDRNQTVVPQPPAVTPPATSVELQRVFPMLAFAQPLGLLQAPGDSGSWYVLEKQGVVRRFDNDPAAATSSTWLDISTTVSSVSEGGLLGMAFHPSFNGTGEVFVSYTAPGPFRSVISRFTVTATGVPDPATEQVVIEIPQPETNHNGGHILFGADGYLYIGLGDGGGGGDPFETGQNTGALLGSILRLDVDGAAPYEIPADNPFAGNTPCVGGTGTMACPEIFAWGLRNPWRYSEDSQTGDLWIGDVGQNAWEEVDRAEGGENFGWDEREGANCFEPAVGCDTANVDPIAQYDHSVGQSVTGGYVYRGLTYPALFGQYLFGDFVSGRVWRVPADSPQATLPIELANTAISISSFGEALDGEVYVVDFNGGIYQVVVP